MIETLRELVQKYGLDDVITDVVRTGHVNGKDIFGFRFGEGVTVYVVGDEDAQNTLREWGEATLRGEDLWDMVIRKSFRRV